MPNFDPKKQLKVLSMNEVRGRTIWRKIGVAFFNSDGSINVYLDALPVNGKLNIRVDDYDPEQNRPGRAPPVRRRGRQDDPEPNSPEPYNPEFEEDDIPF